MFSQLNERLKREGIKTHKERVEELNRYLSNLSEHHDMYVLIFLFLFSSFPPFLPLYFNLVFLLSFRASFGYVPKDKFGHAVYRGAMSLLALLSDYYATLTSVPLTSMLRPRIGPG
jgi:putative NADPH-quinone reductase